MRSPKKQLHKSYFLQGVPEKVEFSWFFHEFWTRKFFLKNPYRGILMWGIECARSRSEKTFPWPWFRVACRSENEQNRISCSSKCISTAIFPNSHWIRPRLNKVRNSSKSPSSKTTIFSCKKCSNLKNEIKNKNKLFK
jgi:hypothetical protein